LTNATLGFFLKKELRHFSESVSLVYHGNKKSPANCELIDLSGVDNIKVFQEVMNDLEFIVPDYMYFKKGNDYLLNKKETKLAGYPNLVVEVWSESNTSLDRQFKKYLYSTSPITEHWYIEQDSNVVECYYGQERIEDKNLADILVSRDGIEFDLRYLKLE
jgi:Uma2 family endonuclease